MVVVQVLVFVFVVYLFLVMFFFIFMIVVLWGVGVFYQCFNVFVKKFFIQQLVFNGVVVSFFFLFVFGLFYLCSVGFISCFLENMYFNILVIGLS